MWRFDPHKLKFSENLTAYFSESPTAYCSFAQFAQASKGVLDSSV